MAFPIKQKIEAVINGWIDKAASSDLTGYTFYKGQAQNRIDLPCIITTVDALESAFPDGTPCAAQVTVSVITRCDFTSAHTAATTENAHYAAAQAIAARLVASGLQAYASVDNVTDRPVTTFYFYDIQPPRIAFLYDDERGAFITQLTCAVNAENSDCT